MAARSDNTTPRSYVVIPARYASTRLPRKMLLRETGKSLLQHTYEAACAAQKPAGVLIATDHAEYFEWMLDVVTSHPGFEGLVQGPSGWTARPADWPPTRYEQKALHGEPVFLRLQRPERHGPVFHPGSARRAVTDKP